MSWKSHYREYNLMMVDDQYRMLAQALADADEALKRMWESL